MAASLLHSQTNDPFGFPPLNSSNYTAWKTGMETVLRETDLWYLMERTNQKSNNKSNTWRKHNKWAKELMEEHVEDSFMDCFHDLTEKKNAKQMWDALANHDFPDETLNKAKTWRKTSKPKDTMINEIKSVPLETGSEALKKAKTLHETCKALDKMTDELNSAPQYSVKTLANNMASDEGAVEKLTSILEFEPLSGRLIFNSENTLIGKALLLLDSLLKKVTPENIIRFLKLGEQLCKLYLESAVESSNTQSQLCGGILLTLCQIGSPLISVLKEGDLKSYLALCFSLINSVEYFDLKKAGMEGFHKFLQYCVSPSKTKSVFTRLSYHNQRKFTDNCVGIIQNASNMPVNVVTNCIALLNGLVQESTEFLYQLKQRTNLGYLLNLLTNGVNYSRKCVRDVLETLRSFGDAFVTSYVRENRNSIDATMVIKNYHDWQHYQDFFGDLLNWFYSTVMVLLNDMVVAAQNFAEEHPFLTAGTAFAVGIFGVVPVAFALTLGAIAAKQESDKRK
ncbi:hypothetical protein WDU94_005750 [Cyamophila willieti]